MYIFKVAGTAYVIHMWNMAVSTMQNSTLNEKHLSNSLNSIGVVNSAMENWFVASGSYSKNVNQFHLGVLHISIAWLLTPSLFIMLVKGHVLLAHLSHYVYESFIGFITHLRTYKTKVEASHSWWLWTVSQKERYHTQKYLYMLMDSDPMFTMFVQLLMKSIRVCSCSVTQSCT